MGELDFGRGHASRDALGPDYEFGPFRTDVRSFHLRQNNVAVPLPSKAFDTLLLLIRNRERVVTKEEILSAVWPDTTASEDSLVQNISLLRRTFGDDATQPRFIITVAKRGYRFIAPVTTVSSRTRGGNEAVAPEPATEATDAQASAPLHAQATVSSVDAAPFGRSRRRAIWTATGLGLLALGWIIGANTRLTSRATSTPRGPLRFEQSAPAGTVLVSGGALSPDGRHLAFAAQDVSTGRTQLWVRTLEAPAARAINATDGASRPFWSPDSQRIGFFANGRLKTVGLTGEPPTDLTAVGQAPAGGTWGTTGRLLFADWQSGLYLVPASGGVASRVRAPARDAGELAVAWPQFLPDGVHYLFCVVDVGDPRRSGIHVGSLDSPERKQLVEEPASVMAAFAPPDSLIFVRGGALVGQRFDVDRLRLVGTPAIIAPGVVGPNMTNGTAISSAGGDLVSFGGASGSARLTWFDRNGEVVGRLEAPTVLHNPTQSPDGRYVSANSYEPGKLGIWLLDTVRGAADRLTLEGASRPLFSPDGTRLAYLQLSPEGASILIRAQGQNEKGTVVAEGQLVSPDSWSLDGRTILYEVRDPRTGVDLWTASTTGERALRPYLQGSANEIQGRISPDGRWVAYASDESGKWEVYVQSFPVPAGKQIISTGGGAQPQWSSDGGELFYLSPNRSLMSVDIRSGQTLEAAVPVVMFRSQIFGDLNTHRNSYLVSRDGRRVLLDAAEDPVEPITVVVDWNARTDQ